MTKTKIYNLPKTKYAKIVILKRLKKSWWLYLVVLVMATFHLSKFGKDNFSTFFVIFAVLYPLATTVWLYFWAISNDRELVFKDTLLTFDDSNLYFIKDNNESKIPYTNIKKVISKENFWMLYISKEQFIYVDKTIFYSDDDYNNFSKLINQRV